MGLREIADELRALPKGTPMEEEVRACLANLLIGIQRKHIEVVRARRRLNEMIAAYYLSGVRDYRTLLREHDVAMAAFGLEDHFHRPGPLDDFLDKQAVTIQANEDGMLGHFWLPSRARASGAEIESAFEKGRCVGHVGREGRPIWLTPFSGEVEAIIDKASDSFGTPTERAGLARRIVALLGLAHLQPTVEVLALVTEATIGELLFERPDDLAWLGPAGSTAIEARGHRRFRAWPHGPTPSPFGRTFDTDDAARLLAGVMHGAPEVVRPRMPISEFRQCVFVGQLTAKSADRRGAYLEELGIYHKTAPDLLVALSDLTGV